MANESTQTTAIMTVTLRFELYRVLYSMGIATAVYLQCGDTNPVYCYSARADRLCGRSHPVTESGIPVQHESIGQAGRFWKARGWGQLSVSLHSL